MADFSIVRFDSTDLPFGKSLTDTEGWFRTLADWERLIRLEPDGIFKIRSGGVDAGVAAVMGYGKVAWIHSVIVLPEHRGKGLGRELMMHCIQHARRSGAECIKLDGAPAAKAFYKGLGFVEEFESKRIIRQGESCIRLAAKMTFGDLDEVSSFDHAQTGLNRGRVLRDIFRGNQKWAFILREGSRMRGYALAREGDVRVNAGPCVVADGDEACAMDLTKAVLGQASGRTVRACVSGANAHALSVYRRLKFEESQGSMRMYLGERFVETSSNFAMISPEKG